jgi:hypothetical protein
MSDLYALRIPKAASSAIVNNCGEYARMRLTDHSLRLADVPEDAVAIAVLRDPIDRFRSAYDMFWNDNRLPVRAYGDGNIDDFIKAGPDAWDDIAFYPATWWLGDAEYVRKRGVIVIPYERLNESLDAMGFGARIAPTHVAVRRHVPTVTAPLRSHYAEDYALREALFDA